jgi:hypothetical protein
MPQDKAVVAFNLDLAPPPTSQLSKPPKTTCAKNRIPQIASSGIASSSPAAKNKITRAQRVAGMRRCACGCSTRSKQDTWTRRFITLGCRHPRKRVIQYSRDVREMRKGRGVLDARLRGHDEFWCGARGASVVQLDRLIRRHGRDTPGHDDDRDCVSSAPSPRASPPSRSSSTAARWNRGCHGAAYL